MRARVFLQFLVATSLVILGQGQAWAQSADEIWIGDLSKTSERGSVGGRYVQCQRSGMLAGNEIVFDSWDMSRAVVSNLCFRVYLSGFTDAGGTPGDLEVFIAYRPSVRPELANEPGEQWSKYPARLIGWEGNNFVYAISAFDFIPSYGRALNGNTAMSIDYQIVARSISGGQAYGEKGPFVLRFDLAE